MLLFWVNSVLKSLVSAFTPVRNLGEGIGGIGLSSPSLFLDQTEAQKAEKNFLGTARRLLPPPPPLYLRIWMTAAPYLKVWMGTVPLGVISYSHGIKLEKVGPTVSSFKSMSIFAIRGNRRQETVSMPFIIRIQLIRRHILTYQKDSK